MLALFLEKGERERIKYSSNKMLMFYNKDGEGIDMMKK